MNLSQIKKKYRDILLDSSSSSSSDDFEPSSQSHALPAAFASFTQKHQRTQSVANKENHSVDKKPRQNISLHTEIIHLKQRLGQANQKLETKNHELKSEYDRKSEICEEKKVLERHLVNYQEQIEKKDKQLIELKASRIGFESKIKELEDRYMDRDLDRQLLKKQISFYELEQKKFKELLKDKDEENKLLVAKGKGMKALESENERLKNDIKRLVALLEDKKIFKQTKNFNQSYLGRGGKNVQEGDCWHSRDTIVTAENFLAKHQITEKSILNGLVKLLEATKSESSHNLKKSVGRSRSKKRRDSSVTCKDISVILPRHTASSKMYASSSAYESLLHSKSKAKSIYKDTIEEQEKVFSCREVVREFKAGIDELLEKNACSKGKIKRLTEWLMTSVDNIIKEEYINFQ